MFKSIGDYIKNNIKGMFLSTAIALVLIFAFIIYINFIGHPMTQARENFNKGVLAYEQTNWKEAKQYFEISLELWQTSEAQEYLIRASEKITQDESSSDTDNL